MIITDRIPENEAIAVAIGTFDGIHRGHRALLEALKTAARRLGCPAVVVTFREHPLTILDPDHAPDLLTTRQERAALLETLGVDVLVELPFTQALAGMQPQAFIHRLSPQGRLRHVAVGFNFRFGAGAQGDGKLIAAMGAEMGFTTQVVPPFRVAGQTVSSTAIRGQISQGRMQEAASMLGRWYGYQGLSVRGKQLGRTLGFPTVNLLETQRKAAPPSGVYATYLVWRGVRYPAMTNIGVNPTVDHVTVRRIESYVLGQKLSIGYGDAVAVELLSHTRGEIAFPGVQALQEQLDRDREEIARFHAENTEKRLQTLLEVL